MSFDPTVVAALLRDAARQQASLTYSEALGELGHNFSRPLMRQLCKALDAVDEAARAGGEPALAVLVVRQSDGLPGQGWWQGQRGYAGPWEGRPARAHVAALQAAAFAHWSGPKAAP